MNTDKKYSGHCLRICIYLIMHKGIATTSTYYDYLPCACIIVYAQETCLQRHASCAWQIIERLDLLYL